MENKVNFSIPDEVVAEGTSKINDVINWHSFNPNDRIPNRNIPPHNYPLPTSNTEHRSSESECFPPEPECCTFLPQISDSEVERWMLEAQC